MSDQELHLRKLIEQLERENAALHKRIELLSKADGKQTMQKYIEQLERENAALREDKERLDWLQKSTCWSHPPFGEDIRVAIDAARKEAKL